MLMNGSADHEAHQIETTSVREAVGAGSRSAPRIGTTLEHARRELTEIGHVLTEALEPAGADLARETVRVLAGQTCSIAVVGQIKAGKSSFINALVGKPGLLPTDVNPSTSTITHLHFRQEAPSGIAALFRFFTREEWQRLVEGGGRLRELTQRLVPGFEPSLLAQHAAAVLSQASNRLGDQFEELLGQSHAYMSVERDVLMKYICASDGPRDTREIGLYSEITRSADLYLADGPFDFPVTIIDTPGTNDPLLMRDEITRSCLDKADAYIVVLTAHQPLSEGDVSLLRILRGLHKERIVVFINRVDELSDPEHDTAEIVAYVRDRLAVEFPGFAIPIVAGSAKWGGGRSMPVEAPTMRLSSLRPNGDAQQRDNRSGLAEVARVLDRLLESSHCAYLERQIAGSYSELARAAERALADEIDALARSRDWSNLTAERFESVLAEIHREHERFGELKGLVEASAQRFESQLSALVAGDVAALGERLRAIVDAQAAEERDALVSLMHVQQAPRLWQSDVDTLRRTLAREFHASFQACEHRLVEVSSRFVQSLARLAQSLAPALEREMQPPPERRVIAPPNPTALGRTVALDLDTSWWRMLWTQRPSPYERGATIARLVREEFHPVADELTAAQARALGAYAEATTRWSKAACGSIVAALARRQDQLAVHYVSVRNSISGRADPETLATQSAAMTALQTRQQAAALAARRLERLNAAIDRWFARSARR